MKNSLEKYEIQEIIITEIIRCTNMGFDLNETKICLDAIVHFNDQLKLRIYEKEKIYG